MRLARLFKPFSIKKKDKPSRIINDPQVEEKKNHKPHLQIRFKINKKRVALYTVTVFIAVIIGVTGILLQETFSVKHIRVFSPDVNLVGLDGLQNKNMLLLSTQQVEKELKDENPYVKEIVVVKQLPDILGISTTAYRPVAAFAVTDGYFTLGDDGRILKKTHELPLGLPIINFYQKLYYGAYASGDSLNFKDVELALFFLQKALDLNIKIDSIDINGLSMIALNADNKKIILTTEKSRDLQAYELESIMGYMRRENKDYTQIDLRFEKPVIQLKK